MKTEDTDRGAQKTELNQARSKPDTVDRPVRNARSILLCTIIIVHNTVTHRVVFKRLTLL